MDEIISVALRKRGGEAYPLQSLDLMNGLDELDEGGFTVEDGDISFAEACDNLAKKGDFADAAVGERLAFGEDIGDGAASFGAAGGGDNAEGAVLVTSLHDTDERGDGFGSSGVK